MSVFFRFKGSEATFTFEGLENYVLGLEKELRELKEKKSNSFEEGYNKGCQDIAGRIREHLYILAGPPKEL